MVIKIDAETKSRTKERLGEIYGLEEGEKVYFRLIDLIKEIDQKYPSISDRQQDADRLSEEDVVVITYGDQIQNPGESPLSVLHRFFNNYLQDVVNTVHILPFFPYSSDDGFAIIDYRQVNPDLGDWQDIEDIGRDYDLMFDAVINHISASSKWFKEYKKGNPEYKNYFIEVDPDTDLSQVTRPRAKPLLTGVETEMGEKHVWTTFSPDQIDLNFRESDLLLEIIDLLLFYVSKGAKIIRLDAIAYLWKEIGTSCIHLPETHKIIQLINDVLEVVAPDTLLLTETNVPHEENISYFGDGEKEADMVYQFTLPPLVLYSFLTGKAGKLTEWARSLEELPTDNYYFNFLASHDGIGLRPVEGILTAGEIESLARKTKEKGGYVSYKTNSDGTSSPYELNITYLDAVVEGDEPQNRKVDKFICSQAILLAFQGVPGIYIHSLLGSRNYNEGVEKTGKKRTINREKLKEEKLVTAIDDSSTLRSQVFKEFKKLLAIRRKEKAFHPNAGQEVLELDRRVFALLRTAKNMEDNILALNNVSAEEVSLEVNVEELKMGNSGKIVDLIERKSYQLDDGRLKVILKPYQVLWLKGE